MSIAEQIHDLGKLLYSGELIDLAKQVEALEAASTKQQAALTVARNIFEYHGLTNAIQMIDEALK